MKVVPYIGVSGVTSKQEVEHILKMVPKQHPYRLMLGVLASFKTLQGRTHSQPKRYPFATQITRIFPNDPRVLNLIHYASRENRALHKQFETITSYGGPHIHGLQLNITWPYPKAMERYRITHQGKVVVLQINRECFASVNHDPGKLAKKLREDYSGLCDYILLDASGGLGLNMHLPTVRAYTEAISAETPYFQIGVAGGLCADSLGEIESLHDSDKPLCIDAEGKLRDQHDNLDLTKVNDYLTRAFQIFRP